MIDNIVNNSNVLLNLDKNDKLRVDMNHNIIIDNDEFQEINTTTYELELEIINTLMFEIIYPKKNYDSMCASLKNIDNVLDSLYDNIFIIECIDKSEYFKNALSFINYKYYELRNKYQKNKCNMFFLKFNDIFDIFLSKTISFCKMLHETNAIFGKKYDYLFHDSSDEGTESDGESQTDSSEYDETEEVNKSDDLDDVN